MGANLTPFQLWSLFLMYGNHSEQYTIKDLLVMCCDSAIAGLSADTVEREISSLRTLNYIELGPFRKEMPAGSTMYRISMKGILFIRKNLALIQDACSRGTIPERVISAQYDEIKDALRNKIKDIGKVIIKYGIQNMGNIPMLFELFMPHVSA